MRESWLLHARIPRRYWDTEIADSHPCAGYLENLERNIREGRGMTLVGDYGVGKTHAACAILRRALLLTRRCMYITAADMVDSLKPGAAYFDPDNGVSMLEALRNRDLLVIDDLGNEYSGAKSGFAEQSVVNLIRHRVAGMKATLATTNLKKPDIARIYGDGLLSLMHEMGPFLLLRSADHRRERAEEEARKAGLLK